MGKTKEIKGLRGQVRKKREKIEAGDLNALKREGQHGAGSRKRIWEMDGIPSWTHLQTQAPSFQAPCMCLRNISVDWTLLPLPPALRAEGRDHRWDGTNPPPWNFLVFVVS